MAVLLRVAGLWGVADGVWLALDPASWSRFWGRFIGAVGARPDLARALAVVQLAFSLYLALGKGRR